MGRIPAGIKRGSYLGRPASGAQGDRNRRSCVGVRGRSHGISGGGLARRLGSTRWLNKCREVGAPRRPARVMCIGPGDRRVVPRLDVGPRMRRDAGPEPAAPARPLDPEGGWCRNSDRRPAALPGRPAPSAQCHGCGRGARKSDGPATSRRPARRDEDHRPATGRAPGADSWPPWCHSQAIWWRFTKASSPLTAATSGAHHGRAPEAAPSGARPASTRTPLCSSRRRRVGSDPWGRRPRPTRHPRQAGWPGSVPSGPCSMKYRE